MTIQRILRSRATVAIATSAVTIAFVGPVAVAAVSGIPGASGEIHSCFHRTSGALRVVPAGRACASTEEALSWFQSGLPSKQWWRDADGDGFGDWYQSIASGLPPAGYVQNNLDCDDGHRSVNPSAAVDKGGVDGTGVDFGDADCDGVAGEDRLMVAARDNDKDGYGALSDETKRLAPLSAGPGEGYSFRWGDCNDSKPKVSTYSGCGVTDLDADGHRAVAAGGDDCDDMDATRFPGRAEVRDRFGHDEDCDLSTGGVPRFDPQFQDPRPHTRPAPLPQADRP